MELRADRAALDAFAANRAKRFAVVLGLGIIATIAILAIEYRLMICTLITLAPSIIAGVELVRARRGRSHSSIVLALSDGGVEIDDGLDHVRADPSTVIARVTPSFALIAIRMPELRHWTIPGERGALRAMGEALAARGARVAFEAEAAELLLVVLAGVLGQWVLRTIGAVMALAGLAGLVLSALGRAPFLSSLGVFAGALVVLTIAELIARLAPRS
jgi:hypothetical protein